MKLTEFKPGDYVECKTPVGGLEYDKFYLVKAVSELSNVEPSIENTKLFLEGFKDGYYAYRFKIVPIEYYKTGDKLGSGFGSNADSLKEAVTIGDYKEPILLYPVTLQNNVDASLKECKQAMKNWPPFHSAHEGFAVLKEEVDELWECVKLKPSKRDVAAMKQEAIQIAAMALRFATEVCDEQGGKK